MSWLYRLSGGPKNRVLEKSGRIGAVRHCFLFAGFSKFVRSALKLWLWACRGFNSARAHLVAANTAGFAAPRPAARVDDICERKSRCYSSPHLHARRVASRRCGFRLSAWGTGARICPRADVCGVRRARVWNCHCMGCRRSNAGTNRGAGLENVRRTGATSGYTQIRPGPREARRADVAERVGFNTTG